ncbi:MAG: hypothetical protein ACFFDN_37185, partial [Candidatus Hodarchaeota archaeon]
MGLTIKIHDKFQKGIEKLFFKGKSTKRSQKLTYILGNLFLIIFIYLIVLVLILYSWTGSLYPEGSGYRLDFLGENLIPFIPEMAIFYVYLFFSMLILTLFYFTFIEEKKGYGVSWSIVIMN